MTIFLNGSYIRNLSTSYWKNSGESVLKANMLILFTSHLDRLASFVQETGVCIVPYVILRGIKCHFLMLIGRLFHKEDNSIGLLQPYQTSITYATPHVCGRVSNGLNSNLRDFVWWQAIKGFSKYWRSVPCGALCAQTWISYCTVFLTGSQSKEFKAGVICSHLWAWFIRHAVEFWTFSRSSICVLSVYKWAHW